ncbi:SDR family NAD(P)-dependent oxidoreductase [Paenibacillus allorhizosphaerae]|uniref:3-oxoacyl-[acyl-carrier-protein] reductase FabG n=1 Tax=Paenibacillus allorhizosphaerae TaxID=2849866 RepID=A0ABN7TW72_9BACL|nr:SDR family NAD(P)-dependent oxidoreductase [Paenibacillus allorhizosphaerae]CAG7658057.1 3-oxoacyl-[acyl-carrier-protein] reductase FabG [Paenibacillus allorhizosphaerae]
MQIDLNGKVAIVTGAGRGIGREIALTLASEGVVTVVTDVNEANLEAIKNEFERLGYQGSQYRCDVRDFHRIQEVVEAVVQTYGHLDILVNNAGVAGGGPVSSLQEEVWDLNLDINLKGTFQMCKAVIPVMKRQKSGRIINAASFAAIVPSYGSAAYASSKAGVSQFTRVLAGELGPWNITVNCYAPGMIPTEMNHFAERPEKEQERLLDTLTLRRWGSKREVANLVCFLASDLAEYITGTMIDVSGGKLATQIPKIAYEKAGVENNE